MTQPQLDRAVALATGESLRTVRRLGFGPPATLEAGPEGLALAVDCPFCGRPCALDGLGGTPPAMAECDPCDVYFDFRPGEVYAAASPVEDSVEAA